MCKQWKDVITRCITASVNSHDILLAILTYAVFSHNAAKSACSLSQSQDNDRFKLIFIYIRGGYSMIKLWNILNHV